MSHSRSSSGIVSVTTSPLARTSALDLVLYSLKQVRGLVLLYHEVRVARHLEDVARHHLLAGEELVQVGRYDLLDLTSLTSDVPGRRHSPQAGG